MAKPPSPPPTRRLLRCDQCGRTVPCLPADVLKYARSGWPRCCGEVMRLVPVSDVLTPPPQPGLPPVPDPPG